MLLKKIIHILLCISITIFTAQCTKKSTLNPDGTQKAVDIDNTVYAALSANVKGLDPIQANDIYSHEVISQVYEGLMSYHYLKRPLELIPHLAEEMPSVSTDGLTHTIKIKKGVKFHDDECFENGIGRELTAEDFIYSWKRLADPKNRATGYWVFEGKIAGLDEWGKAVAKGKADYSTPIKGLQAKDSHTLVIKLNKPYFQLNYILAMSFTYPVPKEAVEKYGEEFLNHPVGTGPFKLQSWVRNSKITLVKNEKWAGENYPTEGEASDEANGFLADAGKPMPFVDKIVFSEIVEDNPRWLNFQRGKIDFLPIPKDNFSQAISNGTISEDMSKKGMKLIKQKRPDVGYIGFNMLDPVLGKNQKLRQAISIAFDSAKYIEKFLAGQGVIAHSPIPPDFEAYDVNFKNPYSGYDLEEAKKLLAEAGYPEGKGLKPLVFDSLSDTTARQSAEFFQQLMLKLNIKVEVRSNTWPQLQQRIKKREAQVWRIGWIGDYPDPQNFFQLFYSKNKPPGPNDTNFDNKEFDQLYEAAIKLPPGQNRTNLYNKMKVILKDQAPWVFLNHGILNLLHHGWLQNYKKHPMIYDTYKYLRVNSKTKSELKEKF